MGKVYLYLFDDMSGIDNKFAENNLHRLPAFRQRQCLKYRQAFDKNACVLAYLLLEKGLREQYGIYRPVEFIYNEYGKPYLRDTPHIFFNISHCKQGIICALADFEIGIDIQEVRPYVIDIARRVCSNNELRQLSESDNPARLFCQLWTKKEAYAKANGTGISNVLKRDLSGFGFSEWERNSYCTALSAKDYSILLDTEFNEQQRSFLGFVV